MIKIVKPPQEETPKEYFKPPFFIIEGNDFLIRPVEQAPYGYATPIGIFDKEGLAFEIHDKPTVTPLYLATRVHTRARQSFFKDRNGKSFECDPFTNTCVDPRVIMARILTWWAFPNEDEFDEIEEALTPLPTIEEAEKWLETNRFKGARRIGEGGRPGYWMDQNTKLRDVPDKIQAIHDRHEREEEGE